MLTDKQRTSCYEIAGRCRDCGRRIWDSWDEQKKEEFAGILELSRLSKKSTSPFLIRPHACNECVVKYLHRMDYERFRQYVMAAVGEKRLPVGIIRYVKPIPELEQMNQEVWNEVRDWVALRNSNIYLWGPEGVGKTALARCALLTVAFTFPNLVVAEVSALDFMEKPYPKKVERARFARILLIDDISAPRFDEPGMRLLWKVLDMRDTAGLRTIVTSNIEGKKMVERFMHVDTANQTAGLGLMRRLHPLLNGGPIEMTGASYRVKMSEDMKEGA